MKQLNQILESILLVSGRSIEAKDIADKLNITVKAVLEAGRELQKTYSGESGIYLMIFNNKLQFSSNPDYVESVEAVLNPIKERELSKAMLEVTAIIAYRQPVTRLEIEELRGVNSDYAISILSKQNIIQTVGRKDAIGKPLLFGTTDDFLKRFQLNSLEDLPDYDELLDRIKVLHMPKDVDLFTSAKDEYIEEMPVLDVLHGQISMAASCEAAAIAEDGVNLVDSEKLIISDESDRVNGASSSQEESDIPDFLRGETDLKTIK